MPEGENNTNSSGKDFLNQVSDYLTKNANAEEVKAFVAKFETINPEKVSKLVEDENFQKSISPYVDKRVTQALKTAKSNWEKQFNEEFDLKYQERYRKEHPAETPAEQESRQIRRELEELKNREKQKDILIAASAYANSKNIPLGETLKKIFNAKDEDSVLSIIDDVDNLLKARERIASEKILSNNIKAPISGDTDNLAWGSYEEMARWLKANPHRAQEQSVLNAYGKFMDNYNRRK